MPKRDQLYRRGDGIEKTSLRAIRAPHASCKGSSDRFSFHSPSRVALRRDCGVLEWRCPCQPAPHTPLPYPRQTASEPLDHVEFMRDRKQGRQFTVKTGLWVNNYPT